MKKHKITVTYHFTNKKVFGQAIVDYLAQDLPIWFCVRLLWSAYFGKTPGVATATLAATDEMRKLKSAVKEYF